MEGVKYPLVERRGWAVYFYFTRATGYSYNKILGACINRKRNKIVEADKLFCFEYDHKRDGWFIENIPELSDHIEWLFWDYFETYVEPAWKEEK